MDIKDLRYTEKDIENVLYKLELATALIEETSYSDYMAEHITPMMAALNDAITFIQDVLSACYTSCPKKEFNPCLAVVGDNKAKFHFSKELKEFMKKNYSFDSLPERLIELLEE